jgi:hypothetical protein
VLYCETNHADKNKSKWTLILILNNVIFSTLSTIIRGGRASWIHLCVYCSLVSFDTETQHPRDDDSPLAMRPSACHQVCRKYTFLVVHFNIGGGGALRYKPEGRRFDSQQYHWNFSLTWFFGRNMTVESTQPLTDMITRSSVYLSGAWLPPNFAQTITISEGYIYIYINH